MLDVHKNQIWVVYFGGITCVIVGGGLRLTDDNTGHVTHHRSKVSHSLPPACSLIPTVTNSHIPSI